MDKNRPFDLDKEEQLCKDVEEFTMDLCDN
jgi:hypothetical protein